MSISERCSGGNCDPGYYCTNADEWQCHPCPKCTPKSNLCLSGGCPCTVDCSAAKFALRIKRCEEKCFGSKACGRNKESSSICKD